MKKLLLILTALLSTGLLVLCLILYTGCRQKDRQTQQLEAENMDLNTDVTELNDQLLEKDSFIAGQKEQISELNRQISELMQLSEAQAEDDETGEYSSSANYGDKYPEMYSASKMGDSEPNKNADKTVYLTFDDGPSSLTPKVLDLLDEYSAKATFFVVYTSDTEYTSYLKEIVSRGHTLAIHSYSHDYDKIYSSVDAFLEDFNKVFQWVYNETGQRPSLFRFPGGSTKGNSSLVKNIIAEMEKRGFIYYDWNVSSGDGSNLTTPENMLENIYPNVNNYTMPVVLMHDGAGRSTTFEALPKILQTLTENEYQCKALDETLVPIQYQRKSR